MHTAHQKDTVKQPIPIETLKGERHAMPESLETLCGYCSTICLDYRQASENTHRIHINRQDLYPEFPSLSSSADAGCTVCALLLHGIQHTFRQESPTAKPTDGPMIVLSLDFYLENGALNDDEKVSESLNGPYRLVAALEAELTHKLWLVPFDVYADEGNVTKPRRVLYERHVPGLSHA